MKNKIVIIILGPTGVGKTEVSIKLASALDTEIISADSMLIYKGMDIATAKPSNSELQEIKHHLIDILEPDQSFSAGLFQQHAMEIIDRLHRQGKIPLVVGGTGLYIRTLTQGLFQGPGTDWAFRKNLTLKEQQHGKGYLYNLLKKIDEQSASALSRQNQRRIIRALEVRMKTGKITEQIRAETYSAPYNFLKIGLTKQRHELYRLINERVDNMIARGLVEETKDLRRRHPGQTAMQAIGYKEIGLYLDGRLSFEEAVNLVKQRSRHYAKRQYTWFRKEPDIQWIDVTGLFDADKIFQKVLQDVEILRTML